MVFLLYVVYERLLPLAESAEDFHGFLRLHRLRAPIRFSRFGTQWLLFSWFSFVYIVYEPLFAFPGLTPSG